jgi:hypothetical protein
MKLSSTFAISAISLGLFFCASLANGQDDKSNPAQATLNEVAGARDSIVGFVMDIKAKYAVTDPQYVRARALYRVALGKYTLWVESTKSAIVIGRGQDLGKGSSYEGIAGSASDAIQEFIQEAQSITGETKSVPRLATLDDAGRKIWNGWKDKQTADRNKLADRFDSRAKWRQWEDAGKTGTTK